MPDGQRGRPRDPEFEDRVFDAAVELYARKGLDGASMGAIARRARVGKASLYLRWQDRDELVRDALDARILLDTDVDTGDIRADLRRLAERWLSFFWTDTGMAYLRRLVDTSAQPGLFDQRSDRASPMVLAARQLVRNAVRRGQLKPGTSPTIVLDMLFGSTLMHAMVLPSSMRESAQSQAGRYLDDLVDTILAAFGADQPPDPT